VLPRTGLEVLSGRVLPNPVVVSCVTALV